LRKSGVIAEETSCEEVVRPAPSDWFRFCISV
jgi:hypothetical protein